MINTTIENTKQTIVDIINNCKLPPAVVELILDNIKNDVREVKLQSLIQEQKESSEN